MLKTISHLTNHAAHLSAVILSSIYVFIIGFNTLPQNLGLTLFLLTFLALLTTRSLLETRLLLEKRFLSIVLATAVLSLFFGITSNELLQTFSVFAVITTTLYLLVAEVYGKQQLSSGPRFIEGTLMLLGNWFITLTQNSTAKQYFLLTRLKNFTLPVNRELAMGLLLSIPVLLVFHALFTEVNSEYARFMNYFINLIVTAFEYVWNNLKEFLQVIFLGYFFYGLFAQKAEQKTTIATPIGPENTRYATLIGAVIVLFGIFSFFQSQLLFTDFRAVEFREVSLYVQNGFWELLTAAVIGYALALFIAKKIPTAQTTKPNRLTIFLLIFCAELLLISLFSHHKLLTHQWLYGLKDQRVLASVAAGLITLTFFMLVAKLRKAIAASTILYVQLLSLLISLIALHGVNLDLMITRAHPIRYFIEEQPVKDYSYLLTNSFDNHSEWLVLMDEARASTAPTPKNYYWGTYRSLDGKSGDRMDVPSRVTSPFSDKLEYLQQKYENSTPALHELATYNLREHQSYQLYLANQETFDSFVDFIELK
jgi:hypothetical protein